jgi:hypothetical protein
LSDAAMSAELPVFNEEKGGRDQKTQR